MYLTVYNAYTKLSTSEQIQVDKINQTEMQSGQVVISSQFTCCKLSV